MGPKLLIFNDNLFKNFVTLFWLFADVCELC